MENRYLCRGKRIDNGEWETGSLVALPDGKFEIANKCIDPPDSDPMWRKCVITHNVDPSTICQCTGYEEIYEKDIFRYEDEEYVIKWSDDLLRWEAISLETDVSVPLGELNPDYMVVIGNEIDNPELLEV